MYCMYNESCLFNLLFQYWCSVMWAPLALPFLFALDSMGFTSSFLRNFPHTRLSFIKPTLQHHFHLKVRYMFIQFFTSELYAPLLYSYYVYLVYCEGNSLTLHFA